MFTLHQIEVLSPKETIYTNKLMLVGFFNSTHSVYKYNDKYKFDIKIKKGSYYKPRLRDHLSDYLIYDIKTSKIKTFIWKRDNLYIAEGLMDRQSLEIDIQSMEVLCKLTKLKFDKLRLISSSEINDMSKVHCNIEEINENKTITLYNSNYDFCVKIEEDFFLTTLKSTCKEEYTTVYNNKKLLKIFKEPEFLNIVNANKSYELPTTEKVTGITDIAIKDKMLNLTIAYENDFICFSLIHRS